MKTYDVTVTREGAWWMVAIPSFDGLTQARRLADVEDAVRSYITVTEDLVPSTVAVHIASLIVNGTDVLARRDRIDDLRRSAREVEDELRVEIAALARDLAGEDVPLRDVGTVLHVSHQRAHQLLSAS